MTKAAASATTSAQPLPSILPRYRHPTRCLDLRSAARNISAATMEQKAATMCTRDCGERRLAQHCRTGQSDPGVGPSGGSLILGPLDPAGGRGDVLESGHGYDRCGLRSALLIFQVWLHRRGGQKVVTPARLPSSAAWHPRDVPARGLATRAAMSAPGGAGLECLPGKAVPGSAVLTGHAAGRA